MDIGASSTVKTDSVVLKFTRVAERLLRLDHRFCKGIPSVEVDVMGSYWNLFFANFSPGQLRVRRGKSFIPVQGQVALFLPAFSIIEWNVSRTGTQSHAYISDFELPSWAPQEAVMFNVPAGVPISSYESPQEVLQVLKKMSSPIAIGRAESPHGLAARVKKFIDARYKRDLSLGQLAQELGAAHAYMTRQFKEAYGLSPVQYRNLLRVSDSLGNILLSEDPLIDICFDIGFNDVSRFNSQFKRHFKAAPSSFRKHRNINKNSDIIG